MHSATSVPAEQRSHARIDARELYIAAYRQPGGRYTENVEEVLKPLYAKLGKGHLETMSNWNTIEKILK